MDRKAEEASEVQRKSAVICRTDLARSFACLKNENGNATKLNKMQSP